MTRRTAATLLLAVGSTVTTIGCASPADHGAPMPVHDSRVMPPEPDRSRVVPESLRTLEPGMLVTVASDTVLGWRGPGDKRFEVGIRTGNPAAANTRRFGAITLRTSARERTPNLGQYPCSSCHLGRGVVMRDQRIGDAHRNIQPLHPAQTGAACATCHAPDNVELLALKSGERATLDHTYRLCAQCHYAQAESWAGGAHGKRLDGWQGRRIVMGCADCHDPHQPAIGSRTPFRGPTLTRPSFRP